MKRKDTWDLYIGNMEANVSEHQIVEYLKGQEITVRKCVLVSSKLEGTKSARVTVSMQDKDKALRPEVWPEFVRVRSWVIKPRWASEAVGRNMGQDDGNQN